MQNEKLPLLPEPHFECGTPICRYIESEMLENHVMEYEFPFDYPRIAVKM